MFIKQVIDNIDTLYHCICMTNAAVIIIEKNDPHRSFSITEVDLKNKIVKISAFGTHYNMNWDIVVQNYTIESWEFKISDKEKS